MSLGTYNGEEKLCFGLDLGTTMTAVSYAHFEDGEEPRVRLVTRWPGQEDAQGDCKVPTVVRYDSEGHAVQFGTEAVENVDDLEDTTLAKWFKLHLHPSSMRTENQLTPPPLPDGVNIKTIYTDFLRYIFAHTKSFVNRSGLSARGNPLFDGLKDNFIMVLAIPNGWDDAQQAFLREAVVAADILPADHDRQRLQFVSEAEASIHFAIHYARIGNWLRAGAKLAVCDAGGSTVDTTVYTCISASPKLQLKEVTSSECVQAGSVFVDEAASLALGRKLSKSSKYGAPEVIASMVRIFEKKTKRQFDGMQAKCAIQFGQPYDHDRPLVTAGRVTLTCDEVKSIFKLPVTAIAASIDNIMERSGGFESLLLVGGFAESKYLRAALDEGMNDRGVKQITIDEPTKKAAAEGAVAWFAKQCVTARAAKVTYGIKIHRPYDESYPEHRQRSHLTWLDSSGQQRLSGMYSPLILKNVVVDNDTSTKKSYHRRYDTVPDDLAQFETELVSIDSDEPGTWCQHTDGTADDRFRNVCTLKADLSGLKRNLRPMTGRSGNQYLQIDFEVEIFFGQTSLCASLVWKEDGQTRKGSVTVIPNSIV